MDAAAAVMLIKGGSVLPGMGDPLRKVGGNHILKHHGRHKSPGLHTEIIPAGGTINIPAQGSVIDSNNIFLIGEDPPGKSMDQFRLHGETVEVIVKPEKPAANFENSQHRVFGNDGVGGIFVEEPRPPGPFLNAIIYLRTH
jgi:hypothetical protein